MRMGLGGGVSVSVSVSWERERATWWSIDYRVDRSRYVMRYRYRLRTSSGGGRWY
jgi:hypothetical protein